MASIVHDQNGRFRLSIPWPDRRRKTLRLGACSRRDAETVRGHVEAILTAKSLGLPPPASTVAWLAATSRLFRARLERCGLVEPAPSVRLADACAAAFAGKKIAAATLVNYRQATGALITYFSGERDVRTITPADAEKFRDALRRQGLRDATVRRRCGTARAVFTWCLKARLLAENPFLGIPVSVRGAPDRAYLVTPEETQKLLSACPDAQWRLLICLARYGGVRVPSEPLAITWAHVDYEKNRLTVPSPKTAHHAGGASRVIPLFPELREAFDAALAAAGDPPADGFVITRYRKSSCNLRTQLGRIARRAGVALWPKPWMNMRATRAAELRRDFPAHIVARWIGHSERIAREHYLLAPEESYDDAAVLGKPRRASGSASPEKGSP